MVVAYGNPNKTTSPPYYYAHMYVDMEFDALLRYM